MFIIRRKTGGTREGDPDWSRPCERSPTATGRGRSGRAIRTESRLLLRGVAAGLLVFECVYDEDSCGYRRLATLEMNWSHPWAAEYQVRSGDYALIDDDIIFVLIRPSALVSALARRTRQAKQGRRRVSAV